MSNRMNERGAETASELVFDGKEVLEAAAKQGAMPAAVLVRLPNAIKTALTVEAARRTMAVGSRVSVNTLIVQLLDDALMRVSQQQRAA